MVYNLFGNLPVRIKHRASHFGVAYNIDKELDRLRLDIVALALAWSKPVRIIVTGPNGQQDRKFVVGNRADRAVPSAALVASPRIAPNFRLDQICAVLSRAGFITSSFAEPWKSMSALTTEIFVRAAVCLEPVSTRQIQFISMGIHPLSSSNPLCRVLYSEVNTLFDESAFGTVEDDVEFSENERIRRLSDRRYKNGAHTKRQLKGRGKGLDRFPMFYIRIDPRDRSRPEITLGSDEGDSEARIFFEKTVQLIRSMMLQFLQEHHLKPNRMRLRAGTQSAAKKAMIPNESLLVFKAENGVLKPSTEEASQKHGGPSPNTRDDPLQNPMVDVNRDLPSKLPPAASFKSWSRIKSGKARALEDMLSGLPNSKIAKQNQYGSAQCFRSQGRRPITTTFSHQEMVEEQLTEDVELLLRDLDQSPGIESGNVHRTFEGPNLAVEGTGGGAHQPGTVSEDSTMLWTNPASGETIQVNSRTGVCVPKKPQWTNSESHMLTSRNARHTPAKSHTSFSSRRIMGQHSDLHAKIQPSAATWLGDLLRDWRSPCFRLEESPIPSVNAAHMQAADTTSRSCSSSRYSHCAESRTLSSNGRLSKAALRHAEVLGQVDKKLILAILSASGGGDNREDGDNVLVLFDQHAVDERCRVEDMYTEIAKASPTRLPQPITFEVSRREMELLRRERDYFGTWGVLYEVEDGEDSVKDGAQRWRPTSALPHRAEKLTDQKATKRPATADVSNSATTISSRSQSKNYNPQVTVYSLPGCIIERCRLDPQLLTKMLRTEIWARAESNPTISTRSSHRGEAEDDTLNTTADGEASTTSTHHWLSRISSCPRGIIELLNSRACRTAIMFNDDLTLTECQDLIKQRLAGCAFPFQCAHGRPSLTVLGGLHHLGGAHAQTDDTPVREERPSADRIPDGAEKRHTSTAALPEKGKVQTTSQNDFLHAFTKWQSKLGG